MSISKNIGQLGGKLIIVHTWGSRELFPIKKFITVLENECVGIKEYCLRELGQLPAVDLQQGAIRLELGGLRNSSIQVDQIAPS